METPLSIVITTYNRFEALVRCLDSIYEQNYENIEVIVVDDHSIPKYNDKVVKLYPNIKYVYKETNEGPGSSRNIGIQMAINNIVVLMDDDDIFVPNAFFTVHRFISTYEGEVPVFHFLCSTTKSNQSVKCKNFTFSEYIHGAVQGDVAHVINKELFLKNNYAFPHSKIGAEILLWYQIAIDYGYFVVNEVLVEVKSDAQNRLTHFAHQIKNAPLFAQYQIDIIQNFEKELYITSKKILFMRFKGAITYLVLANKRMEAFFYFKKLIHYSKKYIPYVLLIILPKKFITNMLKLYKR